MNWLFLNPIKGDDWGGMENWMLKLCQGLPAHGDRCRVAARPHSRWPDVCRRLALDFEPFAFGFDLAPWALARLHRICREFRPDIVIAKGFRSARFARVAWPSAAVAVKLPFAHDLKDGLLDRFTYMACIDRILVDSHRSRTQFLKYPWVLPGRVVAVHNGVVRQDRDAVPRRRAQLRQQFNLPPDALIIGAAGRLTPDKRYADSIEALSRLPRESSVRLVLFGDGPERPALNALARQHGLADRVLFAGWTDEARDWICGFDVLVHPSGDEGLPNVVLEAMAGGVPVVATDAGGTREIISGPGLGRLVPVNDVAALASAIQELVSSPDLRAQIGVAAHRHVRAEFSVERMVESIRGALRPVWMARCTQRRTPAATGRGHWICSAENAMDAVAEAWDRQDGAELVSRSKNAIVHRVQRGMDTYYLKRFVGDRLGLRRVGLRPPTALANFRAASRLTLRGVSVVPHLAAGWGFGARNGGESLLVTGTQADAVPLDRWSHQQLRAPSRQAGFARDLATWLAHLHGAGVASHDLKASNLLVHSSPDGAIDFVLLDLDNCRLCYAPVFRRDIHRNFQQLFRSFEHLATPASVLRFLAVYRRRRRLGRLEIRRLATVVERRLHRHGKGFAELRAGYRAGRAP